MIVNDVTTDAWLRALQDVDVNLEQAKQACVNHYTGPDAGRQFTVAHVVALVTVDNRSNLNAIEADVRSAKARGLIEKSWPSRNLLPPDIRDALFTLREFERRAATDRLALDEGDGVPADVGTVGRSL
ncbi:hypothetical protein [Cryobacterium melibiosiphilum]|uniref:hypothetical protein n=1 Tax=Cryobacterium melibiosiphilum TaxID=995039 RepID=UPI0011C236A8|nr:hypothetical protein [Cryobacterium melibiosiphilum]